MKDLWGKLDFMGDWKNWDKKNFFWTKFGENTWAGPPRGALKADQKVRQPSEPFGSHAILKLCFKILSNIFLDF